MSHSDLPSKRLKTGKAIKECGGGVFLLSLTFGRTLEVAVLTAASDGAVNLCSS